MIRNRIDVVSLGCSKNLVDSEKLMRQCQEQGYTVVHNPERLRGEIVVINTCGFIGDAKEESINMILEACEEKKHRHVGRVLVMGCLSQRYMAELPAEIPEVDGWYGKFDTPRLLADLGKRYDPALATQRVLTTPSHYAYVKVSEGCNRRCAYCAIPLITGRQVSRPIEEIEDEVRGLVAQGVREIQLIAQDITAYGTDLYHRQAIAELVERLADIPGVEWLRLHYGYPASFPYDLLRVMREKPNVCKYLDIALQHISNPVLSAMHRAITADETRELLARIRREVSGIVLRTTLMVGFPGEGDEEFRELMDFVREARFERMGAFAYCEEEGTWAAEHLEDCVPAEVKQQRLDQLMDLQQQIAADTAAAMVGRTLRVVIDREEGDYYVGRTEYDSPEVDPEVLINKNTNHAEVGSFCQVLVTDADDFDLYGQITPCV